MNEHSHPRSLIEWLRDYLVAVVWAVLCITVAHATSARDDKETHKPEKFNRAAALIALPPEHEHYTVARLSIDEIGGA